MTNPAPSLAGSEWGPTDTATFGLDTFIRFETDSIAANAGCNALGAGYTQTGAALTLSPIRATRMMCEPTLMAQETALLDVLDRVASVHTAGEPPRQELILHDDTGTPILRLRRRDWD